MSRLSQYATGLAVLAGALLGAPLACFSAEPVAWLFDQASDVVSKSNLKNDRVENGALAGVTEWDPYVALRCPKEGVDASQLTWLTVRMYSSSEADVLASTGLPSAVARAIGAARPFATLDDVCKAKGMGPKLLAKLRDQIAL